MQRIMNDPDNIVDEMLEGFLKVHADIVETTEICVMQPQLEKFVLHLQPQHFWMLLKQRIREKAWHVFMETIQATT